MIDVRCKNCNKLLFKAESCNIAMICPRCRLLFEYHVHKALRQDMKYAIKMVETTESDPDKQGST